MDARETILKLLRSRDVELACAAALVAGRLRPVDEDVVHALGKALRSADPAVASYFVDGLAATRSDLAVPYVLPLLQSKGSIVDMATRVLRNFGVKTLAGIREVHEGREDWINGAFVKVVAGIHREESVRMLLERLPHACWDHARATSILMRENHSRYPPRARKRIHAFLAEYIGRPPSERTPHATVTCLRLAKELGVSLDPSLVFRCVRPRLPASVRRHGLVLLADARPDAEVVEELRPRLIDYLRESDEENVVLPALGVISTWNEPPLPRESLRRLAGSRRTAVAEYALRTLARTWPDAVDDVADFVESRHPLIRATATAALGSTEAGRERLIQILGRVEDERVRHEVASRLAQLAHELPAAWLTRLRRRWMDDCVASRRYDRPLLELLAAADRDAFNRALVRRAKGYLGADRVDDVISVLQPAVRWRHGSEETRFVLAIAHVRRATTHDRGDDDFRRGVELLSSLARTQGYSLPARFKRAMPLEPADTLDVLEALAALGAVEAADAGLILELVEVGRTRKLMTARRAVEAAIAASSA